MNSFFRQILVLFLLLALPSSLHAQTSNIVMLSGGPAIFDPLDKERHDESWANYVTPPGLMFNDGKLKPSSNQQIWWFVYKPAYEARWLDDQNATDHRKDSVTEVKSKGYKSYVDQIEKLAKKRKWNLRWISTTGEFWQKMGSLNDPIDKFLYWGHASTDLWLYCTHDSMHVASVPNTKAVIKVADIKNNSSLSSNFSSGNKSTCEFWGCNTADFAQEWSEKFKTNAFGFSGKVNFKAIHQTGGMPSFPASAKKQFKN